MIRNVLGPFEKSRKTRFFHQMGCKKNFGLNFYSELSTSSEPQKNSTPDVLKQKTEKPKTKKLLKNMLLFSPQLVEGGSFCPPLSGQGGGQKLPTFLMDFFHLFSICFQSALLCHVLLQNSLIWLFLDHFEHPKKDLKLHMTDRNWSEGGSFYPPILFCFQIVGNAQKTWNFDLFRQRDCNLLRIKCFRFFRSI